MKQIQYFLTVVWGILTPAFALDGAQQVLLGIKSGAEKQGHSTPVEYILLFFGIAGVCVLVFLLFNVLYSVFALPKDGKRFRQFVLNSLLYIVLVPTGWFIVVLIVSALEL